MLQPTALNLLVMFLALPIVLFFWRTLAAGLAARNSESGAAKGISYLIG